MPDGTVPLETPSFTPSVSFDDGDIVLRSSDGHDFCVDAIVLRRTSSFFADMLSLPQPRPQEGSNKTALPIPMAETAEMLDFLLACIYPVPSRPKILSIEQGTALLKAADKYDILGVAAIVRADLVLVLESEPNPLRAWAIATHYNIREAQHTAIKRYISSTDDFLKVTTLNMDLTSSAQLIQLINMKEKMIEAARTALLTHVRTDNAWICPHGATLTPSLVFQQHLAMSNPFDPELVTRVMYETCHVQSNCDMCKQLWRAYADRGSKGLRDKLEKVWSSLVW